MRSPGRRRSVIHMTTAHAATDVRIFEREARSLIASGYDVSILAPGAGPPETRVGYRPIELPKSGRLLRILLAPHRAGRALRGFHPDIVHIHDPELIPLGLRLAKTGHRVVWDAHEDYYSQFVRGGAKDYIPTPLRAPARLGMTQLLRLMDTSAAGVVAATPLIASRYANRNIAVVGNEARSSDFAGCAPGFRNRRALFTGSVSTSHAFDHVVEAVADAPGLNLDVAGRPPNGELWKWAQARLGPRLHHVGWLDRRLLAAAMDRASIGLVTYSNTFAYAHASPTKIFEFAAAGLPVVATPNQCNVAPIKAGIGWLASDFSAAGFSAALQEGLSDEVGWQACSAAARAWSREFGSWEQSERNLLDLYSTILGATTLTTGSHT